jgi:sterol desaturase/sphingolipid hydroxylase (fatty acid hydroxylase superfamily)
MDLEFGAEKIDLNNLDVLGANAPDLLVWAAPVMFFFVLIEYLVSRYQGRHLYDRKETIGSTLVGLGNVAIGVALKTIMFSLFVVVYNLIPWRMEFNWWTFIPCYIIFDLCSYWAHSVSHRMRFLWATHVAHHSGEHFNLTISFRLSWVQYVKIFFFLPVALMGFHPIIIFLTNQIAILFQFWVHTNYGATFIIWDRIFGTYQKEEEQVIYGITHNIDHKHDPIHINFHEYVDIIRDVRSADNWKEKWFYIFGDPGDIGNYKKQKEEQRLLALYPTSEAREATVIEMDSHAASNTDKKKSETELQRAVGD